MLAAERHLALLELSRAEGRVDVADAASRLDVAVETIRRDLDLLQRQGFMRRVHGGAISMERLSREYSISERRSINHELKEKIATVAASYIPEHGSIFVDAGTTTECLSTFLRNKPHLTVVTNSVVLAMRIGDSTTQVILASGRIRPITMSTVGELATSSLRDIHADVAFIGTNGIDSKVGFTTVDSDEAVVKKLMIENSSESIVIADHGKFGRAYTTRFAHFKDIDRVVTDLDSPSHVLDEMKRSGVEVVVA